MLDLVAQFPRTNPSAEPVSEAADPQLDVAVLLSKIRARYKALCATLGVRPRLHAAAAGVQEDTGNKAPSQSKKIWQLDERQAQPGSTDMSF